jgi:hypothetical protein
MTTKNRGMVLLLITPLALGLSAKPSQAHDGHLLGVLIGGAIATVIEKEAIQVPVFHVYSGYPTYQDGQDGNTYPAYPQSYPAGEPPYVQPPAVTAPKQPPHSCSLFADAPPVYAGPDISTSDLVGIQGRTDRAVESWGTPGFSDAEGELARAIHQGPPVARAVVRAQLNFLCGNPYVPYDALQGVWEHLINSAQGEEGAGNAPAPAEPIAWSAKPPPVQPASGASPDNPWVE